MEAQLIFLHVNIKCVLSPVFLFCPYLLVLAYLTLRLHLCGLRTNLPGACRLSCRKVSSLMGWILYMLLLCSLNLIFVLLCLIIRVTCCLLLM